MLLSNNIINILSILKDDNNDDNNNKKLPVPAPAATPSLPTTPRKAKRQFIKERELAGFATLFNNNGTPEQICSALHIARSTYYRYLHAYAEQQGERFQQHGMDELLATVGKVDHTFNFAANECVKRIINQKGTYSEDAEMAALHLLCEIQAAQLRLRTGGPVKTMMELPVDVKRNIEQMVDIKVEEEEEEEDGKDKEEEEEDE